MTPEQQQDFLQKFREVALTYFMLWPCAIIFPATAIGDPKGADGLGAALLIFLLFVALKLRSDLQAWRRGRHWPLASRVIVPGALALLSAVIAALGRCCGGHA